MYPRRLVAVVGPQFTSASPTQTSHRPRHFNHLTLLPVLDISNLSLPSLPVLLRPASCCILLHLHLHLPCRLACCPRDLSCRVATLDSNIRVPRHGPSSTPTPPPTYTTTRILTRLHLAQASPASNASTAACPQTTRLSNHRQRTHAELP